MNKVNHLSFAGHTIYCGLDAHKTNWKINCRMENVEIANFSQNADAELLKKHMIRNYPDDNIFSGLELVNIFGPKRHTFKIRTCFVSWLGLGLPADSEEYTPRDGPMVGVFSEGNGKTMVGGLRNGRKRKRY